MPEIMPESTLSRPRDPFYNRLQQERMLVRACRKHSSLCRCYEEKTVNLEIIILLRGVRADNYIGTVFPSLINTLSISLCFVSD